MLKLLMIAGGGAVGALLRHGITYSIQDRLDFPRLPLGTLAVNTIGCLSLGFLVATFIANPHMLREEYRMALTIGLLGAFTTFSTYSLQTLDLARAGEMRWAIANVLLSNVLGLVGVWLGYRVGGMIFGDGAAA